MMGHTCNRILPVDDLGQEKPKKDSVVGSVRYQYLAQAELALLFQEIESRHFTAQSLAHARSAARYLNAAISNLDTALHIVKDSTPTEDSMQWLMHFNYDRFFDEQVKGGGMPNRPDLWKQLTSELSRGQIIPSALRLRNELADVLDTVERLIEQDLMTPELVSLVRRCASGLAEASALGLMIGTFNDVTPRDIQWLKSYASTSSERAFSKISEVLS
jgi:hypothetical protein